MDLDKFDSSSAVNLVKSVRKNKNVSQESLADSIGLSPKAYSKIETGKNDSLIRYAPVICECLSIPRDVFLDTYWPRDACKEGSEIFTSADVIRENVFSLTWYAVDCSSMASVRNEFTKGASLDVFAKEAGKAVDLYYKGYRCFEDAIVWMDGLRLKLVLKGWDCLDEFDDFVNNFKVIHGNYLEFISKVKMFNFLCEMLEFFTEQDLAYVYGNDDLHYNGNINNAVADILERHGMLVVLHKDFYDVVAKMTLAVCRYTYEDEPFKP